MLCKKLYNNLLKQFKTFYKKYAVLLAIAGIGINGICQTFSLNPENRHYFIYKGKPLILITSAEHYGALLNSELDYKMYLNTLQKYHFNLTRVFVGSYCEGNYYDFEPGKTMKQEENQNTLSPRRGKLLAPWARSNIPGYVNGGNKFDLDKWDNNYFTRLKGFCKAAAERNIIVEIVFFSANYGPVTWKNSPLNFNNNINQSGDVPYNEIHLLKHKDLIDRQLAMVRKIVKEVNGFDNIYFEICNEPYWLKGIPEVEPSIKTQQFLPDIDEWQQVISSAIQDAEKNLPIHHLVAQNFANNYFKIEKLDKAVSILNFHYAYPPSAVTDNYALNRPVAFDETAKGLNAPDRRREAWAFIMTGGAVYDNLDWSYAIDDMSGMGRNLSGERQSGKEVREQLQILKNSINSFDFIKAQPLDSIFKQSLQEGIQLYGLGIKGNDYIVYWIKNKPIKIDKWAAFLPEGNYKIKWFDPIDGRVVRQETLRHTGKNSRIKVPAFLDDQVLRITRIR